MVCMRWASPVQYFLFCEPDFRHLLVQYWVVEQELRPVLIYRRGCVHGFGELLRSLYYDMATLVFHCLSLGFVFESMYCIALELRFDSEGVAGHDTQRYPVKSAIDMEITRGETRSLR